MLKIHCKGLYEPRCAAAGIEIRRSLNSSTTVLLRRGEMLQVISNLIANSIYAMPGGGVLDISVEDMQESQDGIGLTVETMALGSLPMICQRYSTPSLRLELR